MKYLITGVTGFAGSYLAEHLVASGDTVAGIYHREPARLPETLTGRVALFQADVQDRARLREVLAEARPEAICHLAARARVGASWTDPETTYRENILGQLNVFQAIIESGLRPTVLVVGSQEEYGLVQPEERPVREENPLRPLSPYAVSKVAQDLMGLQYFYSHGLPVVRVRPAGHIGPRQREGFVVPDFARQIAEIEAGRREPVIRVGNLAAERDLNDVRDIVRAYRLVILNGEPGAVYNIGSGRTIAIRALLDALLALSRTPVRVEVDPSRLRKADAPGAPCDTGRLRACTGWEPAIPLEQTLREVLDYWRARVAAEPGAAQVWP